MSPYSRLFLFLLLSSGLKAQVPTATIVVPGNTLCTGALYTFTSTTANSPTTYSWSVFPATQVTMTPDVASPSVNITFGRAGLYTMSLNVANSTTNTTAVRIVSVTQTARAAFNASLNSVGFPNQMVLTNYSTYTVNNSWLYSDISAPDNSVHTVKDYTASGNYTVTLVAIGNNGCNDTSAYSFRIADSSGITLPNVFTPNKDSVNDILKPIARGIKTMSAWVYNRYGTLVHSWDKVNGYWDGYTTSGEPCAPGVYFVVLEATGFDGKNYKLKSKVTLLR
jgi:gliding motility-associated-like protein